MDQWISLEQRKSIFVESRIRLEMVGDPCSMFFVDILVTGVLRSQWFSYDPCMEYFPTFTYIYHTFKPNVGKDSRYGAYGFLNFRVFLFPGNSPASLSVFFVVLVIWFDSTWIPLEIYGQWGYVFAKYILETSHVEPKKGRWMEKTGDFSAVKILRGCTNRTLHFYLMKNAWISTPRAMPPDTAVF